MDYKESREYIADAGQYAGEQSLEAMTGLMKKLGDIQESLRIIHVAGTNGKGSVIAFLYSVLQKAGMKTGRYTSPSLFSYREKIEINGRMISREDFARCVTEIKEKIQEMCADGFPHPTPFEIETAAAFLYFAEEKCDIVLLETGMGGSLDATNIIRKPLLSVITAIGYDHMTFLGDTLAAITEQKAGIIKEGCPVVSLVQDAEAEEVIRRTCARKGCPLKIADPGDAEAVISGLEGQEIVYQGETWHISLAGSYQKDNAVLALKALEMLEEAGIRTTVEERKEGLREAGWKGRFSLLMKEPRVIADGAHNPHGAARLAETLSLRFPGRQFVCIMGVFHDKDYQGILRIMKPYIRQLYTIQTPDNARALPSWELKDCAASMGIPAQDMENAEKALRAACRSCEKDDVILVFGSLSIMRSVYEAADTLKSGRPGRV